MKYIITESRLDNIIFNYLDMKLVGIENIKSVNNYDILFILPEEEYGEFGWNKIGDLWVHYKLSDEIRNMFGLESSDAIDVIGRYVEDRYNLEVTRAMKVPWGYSMILKIDRD